MRTVRSIVVVVAFAGVAVVGVPSVAAGGGGCHRVYEGGQSEGTGTTVEMSAACFSPTVLRVDEGAEVTFVNRDEFVHVVSGVTWGGEGELLGGQSFTRRFDEAGTYPYTCYLHPGMSGAIVVGDGNGDGPVVDVTPVSALTPAPVAVTEPVDDDDAPWAVLAIVAVILTFSAFAAGRLSRRTRPSA